MEVFITHFRRRMPVLLSTSLIAVALIVFIGYPAVYRFYAVRLLQFPFDYDQEEGFKLTGMVEMLDKEGLDTVVLRAQFYPTPALDAVGRYYETAELIQMNGFVHCIMRPRAE